MSFEEMHKQNNPLLMCNVWDVPSAKSAEKMKFEAIGTSSAAMAAILGYSDGEEMSFLELERIVKQIKAHTVLPLSVDLESGYSQNPVEIAEHIKQLYTIGVVGVNLEDSVVLKNRKLVDASQFSRVILEIKKRLKKDNISVFLNIRTDTFLLKCPNTIEETKKRIQLYEDAGADGIFIPCIEKEEDVSSIVRSTRLPVNVMCMPNLSDFETLKMLGVKRISMGNFLFDEMYTNYEKMIALIKAQKSFKSIF
ncbi:isocitrate lyase/PEP mutase family protein [Aquimarina algiphila]|uniref:Isocitrate lyase/phosphoenolpyruvate mutase family protein n=1 Tax=Aquimarina algiphila TaxID=2047982 RepID=A0A554VN46_9FLAO|nr:isocitrate lyase/phosphoenolpyruvate mutase family protein [Aquimarina algiphila]TSE09780.1 isocitrate lyase/phosphoenolpyruvate mutase family protein [Aquimarina algiphila]